jgi:hypothetical protein
MMGEDEDWLNDLAIDMDGPGDKALSQMRWPSLKLAFMGQAFIEIRDKSRLRHAAGAGEGILQCGPRNASPINTVAPSAKWPSRCTTRVG